MCGYMSRHNYICIVSYHSKQAMVIWERVKSISFDVFKTETCGIEKMLRLKLRPCPNTFVYHKHHKPQFKSAVHMEQFYLLKGKIMNSIIEIIYLRLNNN